MNADRFVIHMEIEGMKTEQPKVKTEQPKVKDGKKQ